VHDLAAQGNLVAFESPGIALFVEPFVMGGDIVHGGSQGIERLEDFRADGSPRGIDSQHTACYIVKPLNAKKTTLRSGVSAPVKVLISHGKDACMRKPPNTPFKEEQD
jgi:hypothetical protein